MVYNGKKTSLSCNVSKYHKKIATSWVSKIKCSTFLLLTTISTCPANCCDSSLLYIYL